MNNAVIAVSVCLCGGLGAAARYVCDSVIKASWHKAFPLSTFVINSIAGFLAGVIAGLYSRRFLSDPAHVMLATGFLGGFSTFSTMMNESVTLLRGMDYRDADWIVFHENEEKLLSFPCFLDTLVAGRP